jgi:hypothetical protein
VTTFDLGNKMLKLCVPQKAKNLLPGEMIVTFLRKPLV